MKGSTRLIHDRKRGRHTSTPICGLLDVKTNKLYAFADYQCNGEPKQSLTIGRARHCDIKLSDTAVSTVHCRLEHHGHGTWIIEDMSSTNGLTVNEVETTSATLRPGMWLFLGESELVAVAEDGTVPLKATSYTSFLVAAGRVYGSVRRAAAAVHRSRETIRRGMMKWKQARGGKQLS